MLDQRGKRLFITEEEAYGKKLVEWKPEATIPFSAAASHRSLWSESKETQTLTKGWMSLGSFSFPSIGILSYATTDESRGPAHGGSIGS